MEISISVRNLVEFLLRNGDIDNRRASNKPDAMLEGSRIHRMIQRRMGPNYHAEVPLRHIINTPSYDIVIDGRADGIIFDNDPDTVQDEHLLPDNLPAVAGDRQVPTGYKVTIDEIKGTYKDVNRMKKHDEIHLAQAKCYAYIFSLQNELDSAGVRITYCNIETEELRYFHFDYTFDELRAWFNELIGEYRKWADFQFEWNAKRNATIKTTEFPFEYRDGQKELVTYVYQTIYHRRKLFIEAPTGVGKTIATIFPTIKAMGEGLVEKIFYLTAKTITRTVAEQALSHLKERGLSFRSVTLTAKDKICFLDEPECNPVSCEYAKGHYDRVNEALYAMLTESDNHSRETILKYSVKYRVCPFELALDASIFSDMIIGDYNHLFDPHAYLRRFFTEGVRNDHAFLIDEAHNLIDRGRDMYSAVLIKEDFLAIKKITKGVDRKITNSLVNCNEELLKLKRLSGEMNVLNEAGITPFITRLLRLSSVMETYLEENEDSPIRNEILLFYFEVSHFLFIYELTGKDYVIYTDFLDDNRFMIKLYNVNPSDNLNLCMMRGRSSILFSATLLPIEYHKKLLGAEEGDYEVYAKSVFDPDKRGLFVAKDVTSRYSRRNETEYRRIAEYIRKIVSVRKGNYMIFFPSFAFLSEVRAIYEETYPFERLIVQGNNMREKDREEFLREFSEDNDDTLIGMCVMGGIFGEGIDLKAERLIGAVIVGTGIPMVCNERQILRDHFDEEGLNGYDYAYKFPGMNKVLQAAGRVIRTVEDKGIVVLLDERFLERPYLRLFPREWGNYVEVSLNDVETHIDKFWKKISL
ncbi:MAG: ATP-dependent DNA helicase [Lachnospiraceae bacterium]|nr:ATP-dependent DNA helicase [Lachnospiraceae bacterium]